MKHGILVKDDQGTMDLVVCNSRGRAEALRETLEGNGVETYGILQVVSYVDALLDRRYK